MRKQQQIQQAGDIRRRNIQEGKRVRKREREKKRVSK